MLRVTLHTGCFIVHIQVVSSVREKLTILEFLHMLSYTLPHPLSQKPVIFT
jgi:hypothetical protein